MTARITLLLGTLRVGQTKMPRGPKGERRPADVIGAAVMVAKIATGKIEDTKIEKNPHAATLGRLRHYPSGRRTSR